MSEHEEHAAETPTSQGGADTLAPGTNDCGNTASAAAGGGTEVGGNALPDPGCKNDQTDKLSGGTETGGR